MENRQVEYTVEYQDTNGVLFFENVMATNLSEAKLLILQRFPDALIRAVTIVPDNNGNEQ